MFCVGITGNLASGKTTVAKMFQRQGAVVLDADRIAHQVIQKKSCGFQKIVRAFGYSILSLDGSISRKKLAEVAFKNKKNQKLLCSIIHPLVLAQIRHKLKELRKRKEKRVVVVDAALLIESGFYQEMDARIVVKATKTKQIARICQNQKLKISDAEKRLKFQLPLIKKIKYADYVIDNRGSLKQTENQVKNIWEHFNF